MDIPAVWGGGNNRAKLYIIKSIYSLNSCLSSLNIDYGLVSKSAYISLHAKGNSVYYYYPKKKKD